MEQVEFRLGELAERLDGRVRGDAQRFVRGVAPLERAGPDDLSFWTNPRYRRQAQRTRAAAVLVASGTELEGHDLLEVAEPYLALATLLRLFYPLPERRPEISPRASIAESARIGEGVSVGPFAVIEEDVVLDARAVVGASVVVGRGCRVGADSELRPGVVLYPGTRVGVGCLIHAGVILGGDGFGFATHDGVHHKVPQLGRVIVEDDVEIGANTTVDRGTLDETRIGQGCKLDNLVMIAHGVTLGRGCLLAAQAGIAGSTRVGDHAVFAGQSGATGHVEIPAGTVVAAKSAVLGQLREGGFVAGIPAVDHRSWKRAQAGVGKLPAMRRELRRLAQRIAALERKLGGESDEERS